MLYAVVVRLCWPCQKVNIVCWKWLDVLVYCIFERPKLSQEKLRLFAVLFQVKLVEQGIGYLVFGGLMTATLALLPFAFRLAQRLDMSSLTSLPLAQLVEIAVGPTDARTYAFFFITTLQRVCLTGLFFFMMCVAERTYRQVRLYCRQSWSKYIYI